MTQTAAEAEGWDEAAAAGNSGGEPGLIVDVDGFEGPLDLLLHLARRQKVDLTRISILALTDQYLRFVNDAGSLRLELAAEYLVVAAWLAYLKSKLLLPEKRTEEAESGDELAERLRFRLQRLEAMRTAAGRLMSGKQLGRDMFPRGMPEPPAVQRRTLFAASLHDLLTAYANERQRRTAARVEIAERKGWALKEARQLLERLIGRSGDWTALERHLARCVIPASERVSATASSFAASLELAREGKIELYQDGAFASLFLRAAPKPAGPARLLP